MAYKKTFEVSFVAVVTAFVFISYLPIAAFAYLESTGKNTIQRGDYEDKDGRDGYNDGDGDGDDDGGEGDDGTHNPGRDCSGCHSFTMAGTVYTDSQGASPAVGAVVTAVTNGGTITMRTDNLGNFYTKQRFSGQYALAITHDGNTAAMATQPSYGGCNSSGCHDRTTAARVYVNSQTGGSGSTGGTGNTGGAGGVGNTSFDGKTLYVSKCKACHETAAIAQPIVEVVGRGDDVSITKNAITTNKSRTGATTNMTALSSLTGTQLQAIINYTYPSSKTMAAPTTWDFFPVYGHIETPVISADSAKSFPIGAGSLNSNVLNWQIGLPAFSGSVEIAVAYQVGSGSRQFLSSSNKFSQKASIWKTVSAGVKTNESITENLGINGGNLSTAGLQSGKYTLWLFILPVGNFAKGNITALYAWQTTFTK